MSTSQHVAAASHSGSVDTAPTAPTVTTTTTTTTTGAGGASNVSSWSSRDVQNWLSDNDLDFLADRLCSPYFGHFFYHSTKTSQLLRMCVFECLTYD